MPSYITETPSHYILSAECDAGGSNSGVRTLGPAHLQLTQRDFHRLMAYCEYAGFLGPSGSAAPAGEQDHDFI